MTPTVLDGPCWIVAWWGSVVYYLIPVWTDEASKETPSEEWVRTSLSKDMKWIQTTKGQGSNDGVGKGMQN